MQIEYDVGGRYTETRWISEKHNGSTRDIPGQAAQSVFQDDANARQEAAECLKLLKAAEQPKELPGDPRRIVTVRCADGEAIVVKRFPAGNVPQEVRGMLLAMGYACGARGFDVLAFVKTPEADEDTNLERRGEELEALESEARSVATMNNNYAVAIRLAKACWRSSRNRPESPHEAGGDAEANGEPMRRRRIAAR